MKTVDLATTSPSLKEILKMAAEDNLILRTPEGRDFVLAELDDFDQEIALVRQNEDLMQLLEERSKEKTKYSMGQVREKLKKD